MVKQTAAEKVASTVEILGGPAVLRGPVKTERDFVPLLRKGLPWASFERTMIALDFTLDEISRTLDLAKSTLNRRRKAKILAPQESERLLRVARIGARAKEVLGSRDKAITWLRAPCRALGGDTPLSLLDTDIGAQAVEEELVRIEYGVHS